MSWIPSYCLNGFHDHHIAAACDLLAGIGYQGVAVTLGNPHLDVADEPLEAIDLEFCELTSRVLEDLGLKVVVETGGRYWLDPARKHYPVLVSPTAEARDVRRRALEEAVKVAVALKSEVLHCWSGAVEDGTGAEEGWAWLREGLTPVCDAAQAAGIVVAFEPEPGHLVATLADWARLRSEMSHPALKLCVDLGHIVCTEPEPWPEALRAVVGDVVHVQADDHVPGTHEHLPFGEGVLPLAAMLKVLTDAGYAGQVAVELARHSHDAPRQAAAALAALQAATPPSSAA